MVDALSILSFQSFVSSFGMVGSFARQGTKYAFNCSADGSFQLIEYYIIVQLLYNMIIV